jgi:hypothetical protein
MDTLRIPLDRLLERDGRTVVSQLEPRPIFVGDASIPGAFDYTCGWCGTAVLCQSVHAEQLFDLIFRCHTCGGLSATPTFPPNRPWPRPTVFLDRDGGLSLLDVAG